MPRFISLIEFTAAGIGAIEDSVERSDAIRERASSAGVEIVDVYWTLGAYDGVLVFDAANASVATAFLLGLAKAGNVRTQTLRAFDRAAMAETLSKLG